MKYLLVSIIGIIFSFSSLAQPPFSTPGEQVAVFKDVSDAPFGFYEYLPIDFEIKPGKVFPVVFYFHGLGELGNGNAELNRVLQNGPPKLNCCK